MIATFNHLPFVCVNDKCRPFLINITYSFFSVKQTRLLGETFVCVNGCHCQIDENFFLVTPHICAFQLFFFFFCFQFRRIRKHRKYDNRFSSNLSNVFPLLLKNSSLFFGSKNVTYVVKLLLIWSAFTCYYFIIVCKWNLFVKIRTNIIYKNEL